MKDQRARTDNYGLLREIIGMIEVKMIFRKLLNLLMNAYINLKLITNII